jgi:hypothetical protein
MTSMILEPNVITRKSVNHYIAGLYKTSHMDSVKRIESTIYKT